MFCFSFVSGAESCLPDYGIPYWPSRFPKIAVNTVIILCNYRPNHCSTPVGKVFVQRPVSPPQVQTNQSGLSSQERQSPAPRPRKFLALATLQFTEYTYRRAGKVRGSQGIIARIPVSVLLCVHTQHSKLLRKLTRRPARLPSDAGSQGLVPPRSLYLFRILCFSALSPPSPLHQDFFS